MQSSGHNEHLHEVIELLTLPLFYLDVNERGYKMAGCRVVLPGVADFVKIILSYQAWRVFSTWAPMKQSQTPSSWNKSVIGVFSQGNKWIFIVLILVCMANMKVLSILSIFFTLCLMFACVMVSVNEAPSPVAMDGLRGPIGVAIAEIDLDQEDAVEEHMRTHARYRGQHTRSFVHHGEFRILIEAPSDLNPSEGFEAFALRKFEQKDPRLIVYSFKIHAKPVYLHELVAVAANKLSGLLGDINSRIATTNPLEAGDPSIADYVRDEVDLAMRRADGTDGDEWFSEPPTQLSTATHVEISSLNVEGSIFPLFRGFLQIPREELQKSGMDAIGLFVFTVSFSGMQVINHGTIDSMHLMGMYGQDAICSFTVFKPIGALDTPKEALSITVVRHTRGKNSTHRYHATCMPAPPHLRETYASQILAIKAGRKMKQSPMKVACIDVTSFANGSIRICNISHLEPEPRWFIKANVLREMLKSYMCNTGFCFAALASFLTESASKGPESRRLPMQGPQPIVKEEEMQDIRLHGQIWSVSKFLVGALTNDD